MLILQDTPADIIKISSHYQQLRLMGFSGRRAPFIWSAVNEVLRRKPELVLIGHLHYAPLGLLLSTLRPGLRYAVMVHGIEAWRKLSRIQRAAMQHAHFVTSVSEYTKRTLVELNGLDAERIHIVPNTLEWKGSVSANNRTKEDEQLRLLSVCRLVSGERYKGIETVINALPKVIGAIPNMRYTVIGSGDDLERHMRLARELKVSSHVQFRGAVDEQELRESYEASDLFIMPSAGEGFGIVFLEAMHYRKPVIAARCTAVPEVVVDGVTGVLVEYGSVKEVANAIIRLGRDRELRQWMGQNGFDRLQENFTFARFNELWSDLLLRLSPASVQKFPTQEQGASA